MCLNDCMNQRLVCTVMAAMSSLTKSMCWDLVSKRMDKVNKVGVAIYMKPSSNDCYEERSKAVPPMCEDNDDPDAAWYVHEVDSLLIFHPLFPL